MILSSEYFSYNGMNSLDYHMMNVNVSTGLYEENFTSSREIQEVSIKGRDKPYFQQIKKSPLVLNLTFGFIETWDDNLMHNIKLWLCQDYFCPLIMSEDLDKIYFCVLVSDPKILHNGLMQGYCTLQFECNSPYAYSPIYTFQYDLSNNPVNGTVVTINNLGTQNCYSSIEFQKIGDGSGEDDISIVNLSNSSIETLFTVSNDSEITSGIVDDETITINGERQSITTDLTDVYRYDMFNGNYPYLVTGNNRLLIKGNAIFTFQNEYKYD